MTGQQRWGLAIVLWVLIMRTGAEPLSTGMGLVSGLVAGIGLGMLTSRGRGR